jgi:sulfide:quinone oxidoreductase
VRLYYRDIVKPSVEFRQETVKAIDPTTRTVTTDAGTYDADVLVVALGADIVPELTPGLVEGGNEFYSPAGAERLRDIIQRFDAGDAIVSVLGPFYKCPAAPYECAMMLHQSLVDRGVRDACTIKVMTPLSMPIPISREASAGLTAALGERGIEFHGETVVTSLDPATHQATLRGGGSVHYDLFLGVPVHRAPLVVEESGLAVDGWVAVDHGTFATPFPNVYAVGDVTSAPVPRVGVMAEGEAGTVADVLIHRLRGGRDPDAYQGIATCYIEYGGAEVAKFDVNFLGGPTPTGVFAEPSIALAAAKKDFGSSRRQRWFGKS